jgi:hypothetical protein
MQMEPTDRAFLFSHEPAHDRPYDPSAVTHRYSNMCAKLGIDSHLHALRHYSATELLTAGVDLRTVAGRLVHGGGGATTLRVYAAWVGNPTAARRDPGQSAAAFPRCAAGAEPVGWMKKGSRPADLIDCAAPWMLNESPRSSVVIVGDHLNVE